MNHTSKFNVPETEVHDIDNEDDWIIAEIKYKLMKEKKYKTLTVQDGKPYRTFGNGLTVLGGINLPLERNMHAKLDS